MNASPPRLSRAALWGLILSIVGFCVFPAGLAGLILGVVGLAKIKKDPTLGGKSLAISAIVVGAGVQVVGGAMFAIAIQSFQNYMNRAKVAEATEQVHYIARAVATYYEAERPGPADTVIQRLPPSIPRTPAAPPCDAVLWPQAADPAWAQIGFQPSGPLRYAYELVTAPDGRSFVVRAIGDLDCDGQQSRFELTGVVQGTSVITSLMAITDEAE